MVHSGKTAGFLLVLSCGFISQIVTISSGSELVDPAAEFASRVWLRDEGLPNNAVQALCQSRDGYLWVGTARGLARFDGIKFESWDRLNTPTFDHDDVRCLAQDSAGDL